MRKSILRGLAVAALLLLGAYAFGPHTSTEKPDAGNAKLVCDACK